MSEPHSSAFDTDILIAGGGLAGATLALALAHRLPQLRVTVVEAFPLSPDARPEDYQPSYDARSTALAWGSRLIYDDLGLWSALSPHATPIRRIHVSDRGRFGATRLSAEEHDQDALGYVVDNRLLGLALMRALGEQPSVSWKAPAKVVGVEPLSEGVRARLAQDDEPSSLTARCLVVADGGRSGLREQLGFNVETSEYGQNAMIANVTFSNSHDFVAYERFTDAGPLALLPRGKPDRAGREAALVWTLADAALEETLAQDDGERLARLQARFGWRLGRFVKMGECAHYPLILTTVQEAVRPGIVLVGNAAHTLHPVAGQGFNLALRGLMTLVEAFEQATASARPLGDIGVLQGYQSRHRQDQRDTVRFSDSLIQIFGHHSRTLSAARDAGLVGLDLVPGARRWFARRAMGLGPNAAGRSAGKRS